MAGESPQKAARVSLNSVESDVSSLRENLDIISTHITEINTKIKEIQTMIAAGLTTVESDRQKIAQYVTENKNDFEDCEQRFTQNCKIVDRHNETLRENYKELMDRAFDLSVEKINLKAKIRSITRQTTTIVAGLVQS